MINSLIGSVIGGLLLIALPVQASPKLRVGVYVSPPYVIENQVLTVHDISSLNKPSPSPKSSPYQLEFRLTQPATKLHSLV
jgi:hypothetical protein